MTPVPPLEPRVEDTLLGEGGRQTSLTKYGSPTMQNFLRVATGATLSLMLAVAPILPQAYAAETALSGVASWYGPGFHGRTTANGERYDMNGMTAAHKSLKFGTRVKVTNQTNGKSVVVRINDRGPYVGSRIIDLSKSAAQAIDMIGPGTASVTVEVLA
jgi:rare lipoprotein A